MLRFHRGSSPQRLLSGRSLKRLSLFVFCLLFCVETLGNVPFLLPSVLATPTKPPAPGVVNVQQFLKQGRDTHYHGPLKRQLNSADVQVPAPKTKAKAAKVPPSVEPAKMKPIRQALSPKETAAALDQAGTPLKLTGSDQRLEVQVPAGAVDVTQAQLTKGVAPAGGTSSLTLQVTQRSGHQSGIMNVLGTYDLGVVDSQGQTVQGLHTRTPVTIIYHYQPKELVALGINSDRVVLTYPDLLAAANKAKTSTKGLVIPMTNDAKNHTLTAQTTMLSATPFALGSLPTVQQPPKPHLASVEGNTGNLTYSYPIQLPPGPAGFAPQIAFNYSSASPNNRHSPLAPADGLGDGWSLGLGSITADPYPDASAGGSSTWYFLSGAGGVSDRLVPDSSVGFFQYAGYDAYGNTVGTVDAFGAANSSIYGGNGCTLAAAPAVLPSAWTAGRYTSCTVYDAYAAQANSEQNVLTQNVSVSYDDNEGRLPTGATDVTGQTTTVGYSVDSNGNSTLRVKKPGETGSYTTQSSTSSSCTFGSNQPCFEIDAVSSLYPTAVSRTFYDAQGRAVETRAPLDATHDLIAFTVYNEWNDSKFQSAPFRYPRGSSWVDPASATIDNVAGGTAPTGTMAITDPLGRVVATRDAIEGTAAEPGITCASGNVQGTWTSCMGYGVGSPYGDSKLYEYGIGHDANNHMVVSFTDTLGRSRYTQWYSTSGSIGSNITTKHETQYNVLNQPTAVITTDMAPQPGQSITSVTATATYDDLGRQTAVNDPDRGSSTYGYDAGSRQITTVSGSHTLGVSYDLLGRVRCIQDAAPTTNGSGSCSSGSHPLVQNTYGTSELQLAGTTDYATGRLTQTVATTYYPDGTSAATTQQYEHDQRGRVIASNMSIAVPSSWNLTTALPTYLETQGYNNNDQPTMTQTTVGGAPGYTFSQAYDSTTGMLTGLSNNATGVANLATEAFNAAGQVSDLFFQTPTSTPVQLADNTFTYDGNMRPAQTTATWLGGSGASGTIFRSNRIYDPTGKVISTSITHAAVPGQSNSGGSETQNFCYDELSRLVWAGNSGTQPGAGNGTCGTATLSNSLAGAGYSSSYAYTHLGQQWQGPLNGNGATEQYLYCDSNHPHQVTGLYPSGTTCANQSGAVYNASYDAWGNVTSRTTNGKTAALSYDVLNHLVKWDWDASNADRDQEWYSYDAGGQRTLDRHVSNGVTTLTVYAFGLEEHVYSGTGTNTANTYYYNLGGRQIGKSDGTNTQFFLTDALGSVLSAFSAVAGTASVLGNQVYGPYGNQRYSKGAMGTNKGYTGQYNDATGLDYYNARYYDPVVGRFLSADVQQGNLQGMDPYTYVGGNPETMTDPTGQWSTDPGFDRGGGWGGGFFDPGFPSFPSTPTSYPTLGGSGSSLSTGRPSLGGSSGGSSGGSASSGPSRPSAPAPAPTSSSSPMTTPVAADQPTPTVVPCAQDAACKQQFDSAHAWEDLMRSYQENLIYDQMALEALLLLTPEEPEAQEAEAQDLERLQQLSEEAAQEEEQLAETFTAQCSFTAQTAVSTSSGKKPIGTLQKGEKVLSYNSKTKKMELQSIVHVWIHTDNDLVDLTIMAVTPAQHGKPEQQSSEVVHTTEEHPFFTIEKGFLPVAQLHVGMHVVKADGHVGIITMWKVVPGVSVMYNLEVAQDHTFTIGENQWIVHNKCGDTWEFDEHILDEHVDKSKEAAALKALNIGGEVGIWNSKEEGEAITNQLIADAKPRDWVRQGDGLYRLTVMLSNVPGYTISGTGSTSAAAGVRIIMKGGPGSGKLWNSFPIPSTLLPSGS